MVHWSACLFSSDIIREGIVHQMCSKKGTLNRSSRNRSQVLRDGTFAYRRDGISFYSVSRLSVCLAICILSPLSAAQSAITMTRRPGDPPRVAARDLFEYRHLQLYNPEYIKWVNSTIQDVEYARRPGAIDVGWEELAETAAENDEPVVVMVTQTTVSRLPALRLAMKEWRGPVALTVYIEYLANTDDAEHCTERVSQYLSHEIDMIWPAPALPAVSVSFMYTAFRLKRAACDVPTATSAKIQGSPTRNTVAVVSGIRQDALWGAPRIAGHVMRRFGVSLLSSGPALVADAGGGPSVTPVWHFHPQSRFHDLPVGSRPWQEEYAEFYPVNALRNLAWSQVPSGAFVFLNDIDFLPTPHLHEQLTSGRWQHELLRMRSAFFNDHKREALVVPAFERLAAKAVKGQPPKAMPWKGPCRKSDGCEMVDGMALPRTFDMLRTMLQEETVVDIFHRKQFFQGHGCYSWLTWLQTQTPEAMVPMEYLNPCEPYVIALSDALPRYDERFRGRGQNKVEQLTHMAMWGFSWRMLPGHFVLHVPHVSAASAQGGWDAVTTPLVLMKLKIEEVEKEPEFKMHVVQAVPVSVY